MDDISSGHSNKLESNFSKRDISEILVAPAMTPPEGFKWKFLSGIWATIPENVNSSLGVKSVASISKDSEATKNLSVDKASPEILSESDDSISEFE